MTTGVEFDDVDTVVAFWAQVSEDEEDNDTLKQVYNRPTWTTLTSEDSETKFDGFEVTFLAKENSTTTCAEDGPNTVQLIAYCDPENKVDAVWSESDGSSDCNRIFTSPT